MRNIIYYTILVLYAVFSFTKELNIMATNIIPIMGTNSIRSLARRAPRPTNPATILMRRNRMAARKSLRASARTIEYRLKNTLRTTARANKPLSSYDRFVSVLVAAQMDLQAQKLGLKTDYAGRAARLVGAKSTIRGKKIAEVWGTNTKLGEKALAASIGLKVKVERAQL